MGKTLFDVREGDTFSLHGLETVHTVIKADEDGVTTRTGASVYRMDFSRKIG